MRTHQAYRARGAAHRTRPGSVEMHRARAGAHEVYDVSSEPTQSKFVDDFVVLSINRRSLRSG